LYIRIQISTNFSSKILTNQRGNNIKQQLGIQQEKNDATAQDYGEEIKE